MRYQVVSFTVVFLLIAGLPACKKEVTVQPTQETFTGIRETDANCIDLGGDMTDSVVLQAIPRPNAAPVAMIYNQRAFAGIYSIRWGFGGARGIQRVQMSTGRGFTAYGDVEFK